MGGYFLFVKFVVGKLIYVGVGRDFIQQKKLNRLNPLKTIFCPLFSVGELNYLESFLFGVEFFVLLILVVWVVAPLVRPVNDNFFNLNVFKLSLVNLLSSPQNLVKLFNHLRVRSFIVFKLGLAQILTVQVLTSLLNLYQPVNLHLELKQFPQLMLNLYQETLETVKLDLLAQKTFKILSLPTRSPTLKNYD